jgi:glycine cleavage system H protein
MLTAVLRSATRATPLRVARRVNTPRLAFPTRTIVTKRFTQEHELISYDSDTKLGTIMITNYAQESLGDVVFVELPSVGSEIKKGEAIGAVESVKAASDINAPVSGVVTEVNEKLNDQPGLLNKSAEDLGWLCKVEVTNPAEMEDLMTSEAYTEFCSSHDEQH